MESKPKVNTLSSNIKTTMTLSSNRIMSPMIFYNFLKRNHLISTICNKHVMLNSTNTAIIKLINTPSKNRLNLPPQIQINPILLMKTDCHSHLFHTNKPIPQSKTHKVKTWICT